MKENSRNNQYIAEPSHLLKSRKISEDLCRFFQCPITDKSTGKTLQREPDEIDLNIRQMMQKYGEVVEKPNIPEYLQKSLEDDYDDNGDKRTTITLPRHCQIRKNIFIGITICTLICASFLAFHILTFEAQRDGSKSFLNYLDLLFRFTFLIPGVGFLILFPKFLQGLAKESIGISKSTLKYTVKLVIPFSKKVDLHKLEHILVKDCSLEEGTGEIDLLSDHLFLTIAKHHNIEALKYIEQLIKYKVQK